MDYQSDVHNRNCQRLFTDQMVIGHLLVKITGTIEGRLTYWYVELV